MTKFTPYEKLSKKEKKKLDRAARNVWTISPVTRKPQCSKAYNRKKARKYSDEYSVLLFTVGISRCPMPCFLYIRQCLPRTACLRP